MRRRTAGGVGAVLGRVRVRRLLFTGVVTGTMVWGGASLLGGGAGAEESFQCQTLRGAYESATDPLVIAALQQQLILSGCVAAPSSTSSSSTSSTTSPRSTSSTSSTTSTTLVPPPTRCEILQQAYLGATDPRVVRVLAQQLTLTNCPVPIPTPTG
jgi:hypothetical protein